MESVQVQIDSHPDVQPQTEICSHSTSTLTPSRILYRSLSLLGAATHLDVEGLSMTQTLCRTPARVKVNIQMITFETENTTSYPPG